MNKPELLSRREAATYLGLSKVNRRSTSFNAKQPMSQDGFWLKFDQKGRKTIDRSSSNEALND